MISTTTHVVDGRSYEFRLTHAAMMRVEDELDMSIIEVANSMQKGVRIGTVLRVLAQSMNNGQGASHDDASDFLDLIGLEEASAIFGQVFEAAFPQGSADGGDGKKTKRAAKTA